VRTIFAQPDAESVRAQQARTVEQRNHPNAGVLTKRSCAVAFAAARGRSGRAALACGMDLFFIGLPAPEQRVELVSATPRQSAWGQLMKIAVSGMSSCGGHMRGRRRGRLEHGLLEIRRPLPTSW
jgi:hypothetical protein